MYRPPAGRVLNSPAERQASAATLLLPLASQTQPAPFVSFSSAPLHSKHCPFALKFVCITRALYPHAALLHDSAVQWRPAAYRFYAASAPRSQSLAMFPIYSPTLLARAICPTTTRSRFARHTKKTPASSPKPTTSGTPIGMSKSSCQTG